MACANGFGNRPKIKIEYTFIEWLIELISLAMIVISFALVVKNWSSLPARIPSHFGFDGKPDGWGGKGSLVAMPLIALPMYLGLTVLSRFPQTFNYMIQITVENAKVQYHIARKMVNMLKAEIVAIFTYIEYQEIRGAKGFGVGLGAGFVFLVLIVVFGTLGYYIIKQVKKR